MLVQALNLNDTSLTDKGITAVAIAIAQSAPHLEELELALNEITPQGAPQYSVHQLLLQMWGTELICLRP